LKVIFLGDLLIWVSIFFRPRHEAGHEPVADGGAYPYLGEHIVGVLVEGLVIHDVEMVERGYESIDDEDEPQVALGVALPVLSRIEIGERAEQQHRQGEAGQMQGIGCQGRREEDVAQQHRYAQRDGAPVVELTGGDAVVEEIHPDHRQTGNVERIEYQFRPGLFETEVIDGIKHLGHRECSADSRNHDVEHLGVLLESSIHCKLISRYKGKHIPANMPQKTAFHRGFC